MFFLQNGALKTEDGEGVDADQLAGGVQYVYHLLGDHVSPLHKIVR